MKDKKIILGVSGAAVAILAAIIWFTVTGSVTIKELKNGTILKINSFSGSVSYLDPNIKKFIHISETATEEGLIKYTKWDVDGIYKKFVTPDDEGKEKGVSQKGIIPDTENAAEPDKANVRMFQDLIKKMNIYTNIGTEWRNGKVSYNGVVLIRDKDLILRKLNFPKSFDDHMVTFQFIDRNGLLLHTERITFEHLINAGNGYSFFGEFRMDYESYSRIHTVQSLSRLYGLEELSNQNFRALAEEVKAAAKSASGDN